MATTSKLGLTKADATALPTITQYNGNLDILDNLANGAGIAVNGTDSTTIADKLDALSTGEGIKVNTQSQQTVADKLASLGTGEGISVSGTDSTTVASAIGGLSTALKYDSQTLTTSQQNQARANIGAASEASYGSLFQTKTYSYTYTASANGAVNITVGNLSLSTPSGYAPVAILRFSTGSSNIYIWDIITNADTSSDSDNVMRLKNTSGSEVTATARLIILYMRTDARV